MDRLKKGKSRLKRLEILGQNVISKPRFLAGIDAGPQNRADRRLLAKVKRMTASKERKPNGK